MPPDPGPSMPRLVRLYIISALVGLGLSVLFVLLLMLLDVAGLRHLVLGSRVGWLAGLMLIIFNMIVFTGVQFGIAVMRLADSSPPSRGAGSSRISFGLQFFTRGPANSPDGAATCGRIHPSRVEFATGRRQAGPIEFAHFSGSHGNISLQLI